MGVRELSVLTSLCAQFKTPAEERELRSWTVQVSGWVCAWLARRARVLICCGQIMHNSKLRNVSLTISADYVTLCDGRSKVRACECE